MCDKKTLRNFHAKCLAKRDAILHETPDISIQTTKKSKTMLIKKNPILMLNCIESDMNQCFIITSDGVKIKNKELFNKVLDDLNSYLINVKTVFD